MSSTEPYTRPSWLEPLASAHPQIVVVLEDEDSSLDKRKIVEHLDVLRHDEALEASHLMALCEEIDHRLAQARYAQGGTPTAIQSSLGKLSTRLAQAVRKSKLELPSPLFGVKVGNSASTEEKNYAAECARNVASYSARAVQREHGLRLSSEMPQFMEGVRAAAKIYSKAHAALVWIEVLYEVASIEMDDGFVVLARQLAGLDTPPSAAPEIVDSIANVRDVLQRHGIMKPVVRRWSEETKILPDSKAYLASAGRSLNGWLAERNGDAAGFALDIVPNEIILAELFAWALIENPFSTQRGKRRIELTETGRRAAFRFALLERDGTGRKA